MRKRGKDFWGELELYLSDLMVGLTLDVVLVGLMAPAAVLGVAQKAAQASGKGGGVQGYRQGKWLRLSAGGGGQKAAQASGEGRGVGFQEVGGMGRGVEQGVGQGGGLGVGEGGGPSLLALPFLHMHMLLASIPITALAPYAPVPPALSPYLPTSLRSAQAARQHPQRCVRSQRAPFIFLYYIPPHLPQVSRNCLPASLALYLRPTAAPSCQPPSPYLPQVCKAA